MICFFFYSVEYFCPDTVNLQVFNLPPLIVSFLVTVSSAVQLSPFQAMCICGLLLKSVKFSCCLRSVRLFVCMISTCVLTQEQHTHSQQQTQTSTVWLFSTVPQTVLVQQLATAVLYKLYQCRVLAQKCMYADKQCCQEGFKVGELLSRILQGDPNFVKVRKRIIKMKTQYQSCFF